MAFMGRATHVLQWLIQRVSEIVKWSKSYKVNRSPDWSLQLDSMKLESLVIVDQHATVNTFSGLVHTARHTMEVDCTRSNLLNFLESDCHGMVHDWGEVVTR